MRSRSRSRPEAAAAAPVGKLRLLKRKALSLLADARLRGERLQAALEEDHAGYVYRGAYLDDALDALEKWKACSWAMARVAAALEAVEGPGRNEGSASRIEQVVMERLGWAEEQLAATRSVRSALPRWLEGRQQEWEEWWWDAAAKKVAPPSLATLLSAPLDIPPLAFPRPLNIAAKQTARRRGGSADGSRHTTSGDDW
jgi:hypothetical protein